MTVHLIGIIGALLGAMFTGALLFGPSDPNSRRRMLALAIASGIAAIATWLHGEDWFWLAAGILVLGAAPLTPRWEGLRGVRAALALGATLIFVGALLHL